ncbi:MAG: hypothetical protein PHC64_09475 [Candidatus Gastranaerophilales bacterium]|nr:hypothetical protein [Candidatus Gastranaerophilales bacterium]
MNKKNWILMFFVFLVALFISAVTISYYKYFIVKDFLVQAETECDPTEERCFIWVCDPAEEDCTGDPEEDTWYYKYIMKKAYLLPDCDIFYDEDCPSPVCNEFEDCEEIFCEDDNEEEIECTNPDTFILEHPEYLEEDEEDTEEGEADEEESLDSSEGAEEETQIEQSATTEEEMPAGESEASETEQTAGGDTGQLETGIDTETEAVFPVTNSGTADAEMPQEVEVEPAQ